MDGARETKMEALLGQPLKFDLLRAKCSYSLNLKRTKYVKQINKQTNLKKPYLFVLYKQ